MDEVRDEFALVLAKLLTLEYDATTLVRKQVIKQLRLPMGVINVPPDPTSGRSFLERGFEWGKRSVIRAMEATARSIDFDLGVVVRMYAPITFLDRATCVVQFLGEKTRLLAKCCTREALEEITSGSLVEMNWFDASWYSDGDRVSMSTDWGARSELWKMVALAGYDPIEMEIIKISDVAGMDLDEIGPLIGFKIPPKQVRVEAMCRELEMQTRILDFFRDKERTGVSPTELSNFAREVGNWIRENDQEVIDKRSPEVEPALLANLTLDNFVNRVSSESGR